MVMWFNVKEAREFLLKNEYVLTLRPKRRAREDCWELLSWEGFGKKGDAYVLFVKKIEDVERLRKLVRWSGFATLEEWLEKAGESRFLYLVFLKGPAIIDVDMLMNLSNLMKEN